jgi:uncharacterized protein (DUF1697 family)
MYWNVEVAEQSTWQVSLRYGAKPENLGARLHLFAGEEQLEARLEQAFAPQFIPNHEQVLRDQEAVEMSWTEMPLGELTLPAGRQTLVLQASEIQGDGVAEVKALILERK